MIYGLVEQGTTEVRYVGRTSKPQKYRLDRHIWASRINKTRVARWIQSCGERVEMVVLEADAPDERKAEREWIRKLRAEGADLVNGNDGGDGAVVGGFTLTIEQRAKISASNSHRRYSAETLEKMSSAHRGFRHTAESRARMSAARKGKAKSPETRARMREAQRLRAQIPRGPLPEETRAKISLATRGKPKPEGFGAKQRAAWDRRKAAGFTHSEESRRRMSAAQKRRWARVKEVTPQ